MISSLEIAEMTLNPAVGEAINSVVAQDTAVGLRLQGSSFNGFLLRAIKGFAVLSR